MGMTVKKYQYYNLNQIDGGSLFQRLRAIKIP